MNGRTCAGSSNHRVPRESGKFVCAALLPSPTARRASKKWIKAATKFRFTSFTSVLGWLTVCHGMTNLDD